MQLLKDDELCTLLRISRSTLARHLRHGPPRKLNGASADLRAIRHVVIGGERRWVKESVEAFIRGTEKEGENGTVA